jgi:hypothetical protein
MLAALALAIGGCGGGASGTSPAASTFKVVIASVPLVSFPRAAASPNGHSWVVWPEGDDSNQSVVAAEIDENGSVSRSTLAPSVAGAQFDEQIVMAGTTPVVVWREYRSSGGVIVHAAAYLDGKWNAELAAPAARQADIRLTRLASGELSLVWVQGDPPALVQVVAALRGLNGNWSAPVVVRAEPAGTIVWSLSQASDSTGASMAIWTESPQLIDSSLPPQSLWSSRYDHASGAWGAPTIADAGQLYYSPGIASIGSGNWLVAWMAGDSITLSSVLAKRFLAGTWEVTADRVDASQDDHLNELALAAEKDRTYIVWTGLSAVVSPAAVRAARFDAATGHWSPPALIGATVEGYPISLRLKADAQGTAAATWTISQGPGGPFLASTDSAGAWQAGLRLDPRDGGFSPDLACFSANDIVTTWFQLAPGGRTDIVVRRLP